MIKFVYRHFLKRTVVCLSDLQLYSISPNDRNHQLLLNMIKHSMALGRNHDEAPFLTKAAIPFINERVNIQLKTTFAFT